MTFYFLKHDDISQIWKIYSKIGLQSYRVACGRVVKTWHKPRGGSGKVKRLVSSLLSTKQHAVSVFSFTPHYTLACLLVLWKVPWLPQKQSISDLLPPLVSYLIVSFLFSPKGLCQSQFHRLMSKQVKILMQPNLT